MRFIRPNPGECVDRQTILQLKIKHGAGTDDSVITDEPVKGDVDSGDATQDVVARTVMKGKSPVNIQPFIDENEEIQKYLEKNYFPDIAAFPDKQKKFDIYFEQLLDVNSDLWKLEDQARIYRDIKDKNQRGLLERKAEVLDLITSSNDRRAMLVRQINTLWNIYQVEKLHQ